MKKMKKFLSVFLALIMVISIIPMSSITAGAANGIQTKIDLIRTIYDTGSYFTSDGYPHNMQDLSVCPVDPNNSPMPYVTCECSLSQQKKKTTGLYSGAEVAAKTGSHWSCNAFTTYVFYNIFNKNFSSCGKIDINNAKLGDAVSFDWNSDGSIDHYAIYLYTSGSNVYVYGGNEDGKCKVIYGAAYAKSSVKYVYRASNYDSVNSSTPTPDIDWVTGLAGQYYLESKDTGYWLSVSESKDASTQPINTWGTWWENFRVKLVASGDGYKINFPLVSSLLMNPYSDTPTVGTKVNLYKDVNNSTQWWGFEKVGDAYAIRCMYNPSVVLTSNGTAQATLTTYTGAANQLWYLHPYSYTVSYNANGGSGAPSSQTKYFNEALTLSSTQPTRSGYTFLGWSTSSTSTTATYSAGSSFTNNTNTILYAVWKENVKTYTISYDAMGGTGAPSSQTKTHGTSLTLSSVEPTKDGYLFLGWTTDDMNTIEYLPGDTFTINSDTTLYAVWVEISELILNNEWTVWTSTDIWVTSLSVATGSDKPDVAYYYVPQETGKYIFYSTNASDSEVYLYDDSGEQIGYDDDSGENLNFRLECELVAGKEYTFLLDGVSGCNVGFGEIYTITYDANGGTGAPQSQQRAFNEVLLLSDTIPSRSGYTFLGWSDGGPLGSVTYQPGGEFYYLLQDITLYAVWQKDVIDDVVEPEVHISSTSVNLTLGETESTDIYAWATGVTCSYTVQYQIADTSIVSCVWGEWDSENKCPLTITAKAKGTTIVTVSVINYETKEILDSIVVTVNVGVSSSYVDFSIKEPSTTTIRYKDGIVLHIDGQIPDGARIEWAVDNNNFDGGIFDNGMSCLFVSKNNGYTTVVATLYDTNDNVLATDSVELRSKAGFFDKIGGFFRSLFGTTKVYDA